MTTTVIAVVLAGFALGSALGGLLAERARTEALRGARQALVATAVLMAFSPVVLSLVYGLGARGTGGMMLSVIIAFFPASVLVTLPSPLLAKLAVEARPGREGSSLGLVLAAGSLGAIAGAILAGFVTLPLFGSVATFTGCGAVALLCLLVLRDWGGTTGAPLLAMVLVAASLATGSACRYESGLSCIDTVTLGGATQLYSDRTIQAGERAITVDEPATRRLTLAYTQWIWARMDADLGPDASVLFIGGGGYTLPAQLLASRPNATAVVVEIDPLMTQVVRADLPWRATGSRGRGSMLRIPKRKAGDWASRMPMGGSISTRRRAGSMRW